MDKNRERPVYEVLSRIHQSFEEIVEELERLQKLKAFGKQEPIKNVTVAVRETHAWTVFEILEILHMQAENEWTRLGHLRRRLESGLRKPRRPSSK